MIETIVGVLGAWLVVLAFIAILGLVPAWLLMLAWNELAVGMFQAQPVTFFHAWLFLVALGVIANTIMPSRHKR